MSDHEPYDEPEDGLRETAEPEAASAPAHRRARIRRLSLLAVISFVVTFIVAFMGLLVFDTLPKLSKVIDQGETPLSLTVLDNEGRIIASRGGQRTAIVPLGELPPYLIKAFVATEDRRFYEHHGIDPRGIARAMWANIRAGGFVEGGSTITQQLVKNLYLVNDRTLWRKAQEALIALWLENHLSKDEILTLYVNRIYLGGGTYGVDAASQYYFGKSARDISLAEAAVLAGLPKSPTRFAPTNDLALARKRAGQVLDRLVDSGVLTPQEVADARAHPATLSARATGQGPQYFVDWIASQVSELVPDATGRLTVKTTLDSRRQGAAENAVMQALNADATRNVGEGALIALGPDGAIRAMVGGRSYRDSQFNRATQAKRQPGSAFKPVIYLAALQSGLTPDTPIVDSPVALGDWQPQNANARFSGEVTLAEALAKSINTIAVKLADRVGLARINDAAHELGFTSPLQQNLSIALGSSEVSLLEMTSAYSVFPNEGRRAAPYGITEITDGKGTVLYTHAPLSQQVIDENHARDMNFMLNGVVTYGTGIRARLGDRMVAGKTGTSQDNRDAWFIGYSANETVGVWFGNDDNAPMRHVSGGSLAAPVWRDYMTVAQANEPKVALAGVNRDPRIALQAGKPIGHFFSKLADLFAAAPRLDEQPREETWGAGFRRGGSNLGSGR